jgi:hypothetical protein
MDAANTALSNAADVVGGPFSKENNETEIPDDVGVPDGEMVTDTGPDDGQEVAAGSDMEDVAAPSDGEMVTDTGPDDGQEVAAETDMENVATPSDGEGESATGPDDVSSASLLMSSMIGIAAVTTAFVAIA